MSLPLALTESRSKDTGALSGEMSWVLLQEVKNTPRYIKIINKFLIKRH